MQASHRFTHLLMAMGITFALSTMALAAEPGSRFPDTSSISDQKAGSMLVYNVYTSSITNFNAQNSRLSITNTNENSAAFVHLFFVDGSTCAVADMFVCLTANQTYSFLVSDLDPGVTGYLMAIAVDGVTGCPVNFNYLIGDVYVKFPTGHTGNLAAESIAAQFETFSGCNGSTSLAQLFFDQPGTPDSYNALPRVLAVDNITDRMSGNNTLLILNRIGGNMAISSSPIGSIFGLLYDDAENAFSFSFSSGACQFRSTLSNTFPRTVPRFEVAIPAGRSGWMRIYSTDESVSLLGSVFTANPNANTFGNAFEGARNLHKLTLNTQDSRTGGAQSITIPVFPPSC